MTVPAGLAVLDIVPVSSVARIFSREDRQSVPRSLSRPRRSPAPARSRERRAVSRIPEYLTQSEVETLLRLAPNPQARIIMAIQWRAGLRISEALALEVADIVTEDLDHPLLRVRLGKGRKPRLVPLHPELRAALTSYVGFMPRGQHRLVTAVSSTAWRWVQQAGVRAVELGALGPAKRIGTHTFRHSAARHWLAHGVPINAVSVWLGHSSLQTTLIYLKLFPDPGAFMERVP